jgi:hypothetical protein
MWSSRLVLFFYIANLSATGKSCYEIKGKPFSSLAIPEQARFKKKLNKYIERKNRHFYLLNMRIYLLLLTVISVTTNKSGLDAMPFYFLGLLLF